MKARAVAIVAALVVAAGGAAHPQPRRSLVVYCSHDPDACELAASAFGRETGIATSTTRVEDAHRVGVRGAGDDLYPAAR